MTELSRLVVFRFGARSVSDQKLHVRDAFYSAENSGLNFRTFPATNGTTLSRFSSGKEDNLTSFAKLSWIFFLLYLIFHLKFQEFLFEWLSFRKKFNNFSDFLDTFPVKFPYHLLPFQNFRQFWLNGKRLSWGWYGEKVDWCSGRNAIQYANGRNTEWTRMYLNTVRFFNFFGFLAQVWTNFFQVWDLKNMRSPLTTINTDSSVNR